MIKLTSNWSRKISDQNFGSKGAGCALEIEVDGAMLERSDELQARLRRLFEICRLSVDDELAAQGQVGNGHTASNGNGATASGNGHANANGTTGSGNGHTNGTGNNGHRASTKQLDYAQQL